VADYIGKMVGEADKIGAALALFESNLTECRTASADFSTAISDVEQVPAESNLALDNALAELTASALAYVADRGTLVDGISAFLKQYGKALPADNAGQHKARQSFNAIADQTRGLVKQIDLLYKQAARAQQLAVELAGNEAASEFLDRRATTKRIKQLDEDRKLAVEQLKDAAYFHRQIAWLQDRFPSADFVAVPGLCKVVTLAEIEAADWSLTPGRYVGVAPQEVDEDFDFEQTLRDIHVELADLNREAVELAAKIQENFEELGI
jgi:type I restriction enzyme M protein